jgi:hypothetical protein
MLFHTPAHSLQTTSPDQQRIHLWLKEPYVADERPAAHDLAKVPPKGDALAAMILGTEVWGGG